MAGVEADVDSQSLVITKGTEQLNTRAQKLLVSEPSLNIHFKQTRVLLPEHCG